jgi:hypothetical protein
MTTLFVNCKSEKFSQPAHPPDLIVFISDSSVNDVLTGIVSSLSTLFACIAPQQYRDRATAERREVAS